MAILPWGDRFEDFHARIGVTFESFRDELTGGWLFNYVEALQRAGVRPVLYYASSLVRDPLRFTHGPTGVEVRVLPSPSLHRKVRAVEERYRPGSPSLRALAAYLATPLRLLGRELKADRCASILCHEYEYPRFDVMVALGNRLGMPVFATFQGADRAMSQLETPFRLLSVPRAAGLVVASQLEAQRVRVRYRLPRERVALIPNPVDVSRWRPLARDEVRSELDIPLDARVVMWQGRVEVDKKGLDVLLEAWARLERTHAGYRPMLVLIGIGRDSELLRELIRRAAPARVRWIDRYITDRELLWRYLSAADIATLPSRREGFAVAAVEAMACGLPVVAADANGVVDALGKEEEVGIVVQRDDPAALAEALGRLIADGSLARAMGTRGRRRAEQRFSLDVVGRQLRSFLRPDGYRRGGSGASTEAET
jgi:starch synthase